MPLDEAAALALAGPDVRDLEAAKATDEVTAAHVQAAEKAAQEADAKATQSEHRALAGELAPHETTADREAARFASLRAAVTRRRAERHAQAERLRQLEGVGRDALALAAELPGLKEQDASDQAELEAIQTRRRERAEKFSARLADIAARGHALAPEPVPPSSRPPDSSAHVWAGVRDNRPQVNVQGRVISGIRLDHPDGLAQALEEADRQTGKHDPSVRLVRGENGIVIPLSRDQGGHLQRKIDRGELHELTLPEREAYWRGEAG